MADKASMTQNIRRDRKVRRTPRLGLPKRDLTPPSTLQDGEKPGFWTDLVLPGPKGDPQKKLARAERVRHGVTVTPPAVRMGAANSHYEPLHRTRVKARSGGGIDRSKPTPAAVANRAVTQQRTAARRAARLDRQAA